VNTLPKIGPIKTKQLEKLNIHTISNLLNHYPKSYLDFRFPVTINHLKAKKHSSFNATLHTPTQFKTKNNKLFVQSLATDHTGQITLSWFHNYYISKIIKDNQKYTITGIPTFFGNKLTLISPQIELLSSNNQKSIHNHNLVPIYPQTEGINSKWLRNTIYLTLKQHCITDPIPSSILKKQNLISYQKALLQIHFPQNPTQKHQADLRLSFNKHFLINLTNLKEKLKLSDSIKIKINKKIHTQTKNDLPFILTKDQTQVTTHIYSDLQSTSPTHRLIQGDTGSGKTILTIFASTQILAQNYSTLLLAPTQILAKQHQQTFKKLSNLNTKFVTSKSKLKKLPAKPTVFIGTHALLSQLPQKLKFPLMAVFIDEQHKFGVKQREFLSKRKPTPHIFNLTATPIPRTLALGIFGDIKISNIKNAPKSRQIIKTWVISHNYLYQNGTNWLKNKLKAKQKIFVVCPIINLSQHLTNTESTIKIFKDYKQNFPQTKVYLLHGKLTETEKNKTLSNFKKCSSAILVTTPIIEVGVDIPEANIIIIHSAERFGLATLHQLRGRVGRGGQIGYCFLIPSKDKDEEENARLNLLTKYNSGLTLARLDLKLRGAGQFTGLKQHGHFPTRLKYFWDKTLYQRARKETEQIYIKSPQQAHNLFPLRARLPVSYPHRHSWQ